MGFFAAFAELVTPPESDPNCAAAAPAFCVILELFIWPRTIRLHSREESLDEPARPLLLLSDCCHGESCPSPNPASSRREKVAIVFPVRFTQSQGPSVS